MKDIFQNSSSNWVRYNKYEWRTSADGKCYITPAADAKPSIYNPIKDYEKLVLTAINIGTTAMNKASESELKEAIMGFVSEYGMLGLMTALPTTPDFITYEAVYLPKNHFIKEENISTERYLSYFFPFDKIDFRKKCSESSWSTDSPEMMALIMTMKNKKLILVLSCLFSSFCIFPGAADAAYSRAAGQVADLPKGYDESKSIYALTEDEIRAAAEFRGGKFLGPADRIGKKGAVFDWECENGHRFRSSLEYILLGGGWCPECGYDKVYSSVSPKNRFISAVLSPQSRG